MLAQNSCNNVWSAQILGKKLWRLLPPDHTEGIIQRELRSAGVDYLGSIDAIGYEAVLVPGDVIVWYVGWRSLTTVSLAHFCALCSLLPKPRYAGWTHGTETIETPGLALSKEFFTPVPSVYLDQNDKIFRAHSGRFGSYAHCFELWAGDRMATQHPVDEL
jgi:hypothetical protein